MAKTKRIPTIPDVIRKRRTDLLVSQGYWSLLWKCAALVLAVYVLLTQVFLLTQVSGNDMFPAVKDGDLVFAYRLQGDYAKNDVVVYRIGGERKVGRIIGREGDVIMMDDSGTLQINGTTQSGEILYPTYAKEGYEYPYIVPEDTVFLLGDYRTQTTDSRDHGPVQEADIEGKVITILRRRGI